MMQRAPARGGTPLDVRTRQTRGEPLGISLVTAAVRHGCHCKPPVQTCLPAAPDVETRPMHLGLPSVGAVSELAPPYCAHHLVWLQGCQDALRANPSMQAASWPALAAVGPFWAIYSTCERPRWSMHALAVNRAALVEEVRARCWVVLAWSSQADALAKNWGRAPLCRVLCVCQFLWPNSQLL